MATGNRDEEKDRLTSEEFMDLIPHLSFAELLQIEFLLKSWKLLVTQTNSTKAIYMCNLCKVPNSGIKSIYSHINGKKHQLCMKDVKQLYHPEYTLPKTRVQNRTISLQSVKELPKKIVGTITPRLTVRSLDELRNPATVPLIIQKIEKKADAQELHISKNAALSPADKLPVEKFPKPLSKEKEKQTDTIINLSEFTVETTSEIERSFSKNMLPTNKIPISLNWVKNPIAPKKTQQLSTDEGITKQTDAAKKALTDEDAIIILDNDDSSSKSKQVAQPSEKGNDDTSAKNKHVGQASKRDNSSSNVADGPGAKKSKPSEQESVIPTVLKSGTGKSTEGGKDGKYRSNVIVIPTVDKMKNAADGKKNEKKKSVETTDSMNVMLGNHNGQGSVGVEYVIKIFKPNFPTRYECGLCEIMFDENALQNHLQGYNHRLKFCEKHFPTAIRQFKQYMLKLPLEEHYKIMIPVLQKLAVAIEQHHGQSSPYECAEQRYNLDRYRVLTEVFGRRHASEQQGPTFTHVVTSKEIDELIKGKDSNAVQSATLINEFNQQNMMYPFQETSYYPRNPCMSSSIRNFEPEYPPLVDDETHKRMVENFLKANNKDSGRSGSRSDRYRTGSSNRSAQAAYKTQSSSRFFSSSEKHISKNQHDIWRSYCRLVDHKLNGLEECFQQYKANPESHPLYKDEWLKFWNRRKGELIAAGKDYRTFNYQPDWVAFFNDRIKELYNQAIESVKIQSREELSLPMTNNYLKDSKYHVHIKPITQLAAPAMELMSIVPQLPVLQLPVKLNVPTVASYQPELSTASLDIACPQPITAGIQEPERNSPMAEEDFQDETSPTVVSVLRLLTALEEYLGSLGPKIVDLLSKALQAEKYDPASVNELLTDENCTLLETAMEKFKGLVIAGILEAPKVRALKKAVTKVKVLLQFTKETRYNHLQRKGRLENTQKANNLNREKDFGSSAANKIATNFNKEETQNRQLAIDSNISRSTKLFEQKIAAALKAKGQTDFDHEHLEQLAAVCALLDKKKREASIAAEMPCTNSFESRKPLSGTLTDFLSSLSSKSDFRNTTPSNTTASQATMASLSAQQKTAQANKEFLPFRNNNRGFESENLMSSQQQGNSRQTYNNSIYRDWMGDQPNLNPLAAANDKNKASYDKSLQHIRQRQQPNQTTNAMSSASSINRWDGRESVDSNAYQNTNNYIYPNNGDRSSRHNQGACRFN